MKLSKYNNCHYIIGIDVIFIYLCKVVQVRVTMIEELNGNIEKLIAAYEAAVAENAALRAQIEQFKSQNEDYGKQIIELERKIDNLKLTEAFLGGSTNVKAAKEKIERMIREIDKCISLMEA